MKVNYSIASGDVAEAEAFNDRGDGWFDLRIGDGNQVSEFAAPVFASQDEAHGWLVYVSESQQAGPVAWRVTSEFGSDVETVADQDVAVTAVEPGSTQDAGSLEPGATDVEVLAEIPNADEAPKKRGRKPKLSATAEQILANPGGSHGE